MSQRKYKYMFPFDIIIPSLWNDPRKHMEAKDLLVANTVAADDLATARSQWINSQLLTYCQTSNIRSTISPNLNVSHLVLQFVFAQSIKARC